MWVKYHPQIRDYEGAWALRKGQLWGRLGMTDWGYRLVFHFHYVNANKQEF